MKKSISILLFSLFILLSKAQDTGESIPYQEGIDPEFLTGLKSRFELSVGVGYAYINNLTLNSKTTALGSYNEKLSGGLSSNIGIGYNFTDHFQTKLTYDYRTSNASQVYSVQDTEGTQSYVHLSEKYQFHQVGASVLYRFPVVKDRLSIAPQLGMGYLSFKNKGTRIETFVQKSKGWVFISGLGIDYLASNVVGIGVHLNYSYTDFGNTQMDYPESMPENPVEADTEFDFVDITAKLFIFF